MNYILLCWNVFAVVWIIGMVANKRTRERRFTRSRLADIFFALLAVWLLFGSQSRSWSFPLDWFLFGIQNLHAPLPLDLVLLPPSPPVDVIGFFLTFLGLTVAIWARLTLGTNWSGTVTYKENHELIQSGPYALVRHPIYTGLLLMFLGTAFAIGTCGAFLSVPTLFLSFWIKSRQEEALMIEHFGEHYATYRQRVRGIIPFVF